MSNTIDLVNAAKERQYIKFEDLALEMLKAKVQENPIMRDKLAQLNVAQGLAEAEDKEYEDEDEKDMDDKDDKEDKDMDDKEDKEDKEDKDDKDDE